MPKKVFLSKLCNVTGELGWQPKKHPDFEPFHGLGLAHDVLEHDFKNDDYSIGFEIKAAGVALVIREYFAYNSLNKKTVAENFVHMCTKFSDYYEDGRMNLFKFYPCKKQPKCSSILEEEIKYLVRENIKSIKKEIVENEGEKGYISMVNAELLKNFSEYAPDWFRSGVHYAERKYGSNMYEFQFLFQEIERLGQLASNHIEENTKLTIGYDTHRPTATLKIVVDYIVDSQEYEGISW